MNTQTWRARTRLAAGLIAAATTASACGAVPGVGGDDATATEPAAASAVTETTLTAAPVAAEPAEAEPAQDAADTGDAEAEARAVGRTGPLRELPGLAAWADLDLHPFLVEVLDMPPETPIPNGIVLTYAQVRQNVNPDGSSRSFHGTFLPTFERTEFMTIIPALVGTDVWTASGVKEDLDNNSTALEFETDDPTSPYGWISFKFEDATAERQAKLTISTSTARAIYGPDLVVNEALFPWMADIAIDPSMTESFTIINLGRLEGRAELDRRLDGPVGSFDALKAFFALPTGADVIAGETETYDRPWPGTEVEITRADGFYGDVDVYLTDPEDEVGIIISGYYDL